MEIKNKIGENVLIVAGTIDEGIKKKAAEVFLYLWKQVKPPVLYVVIDSNGGLIGPALDIHDWIKSYKGKTVGIAYGRCGSAANAIFAACSERLSVPNNRFFFHSTRRNDLSISDKDQPTDMDMEEYWKLVRESYKETKERFFATHLQAGIPKEILEKLIRSGDLAGKVHYPQDLMSFGFVHKIITELPF